MRLPSILPGGASLAIASLCAALATGSALAASPPAAPTPAPAAPAAAAAPVDPAARAEAKALREEIGASNLAAALVGQVIRVQLVRDLATANNKNPQDVVKIVDEVMMPDFQAAEPRLDAVLVDIWARTFTVEELKGLQEFFRTPLGEKWNKAVPAMQPQVQAALHDWAQPIYTEAAKRHADELRKRGLTKF